MIVLANWDAVGVIGGFVGVGCGGLYTAIRNFSHDIKKELGEKLDLVGQHLDKQDRLVDDTRMRVSRIEGRLSIVEVAQTKDEL